MLPTVALVVSLVALAFALFVAVRAVVRARRRIDKRARVVVGPAASRFTVGSTYPIGKRGKHVRVVAVDKATGAVDIEPFVPPSAAGRKAEPSEIALLRALGFDPRTHDLWPVSQPWRGVQVLKDGERVRFFTERQVRKKAGAWKTALRTGAIA